MNWFSRRIYADTAAATAVDKRVGRVVAQTMASCFGNPSSITQEGVAADKLLSQARADIARFLSAHPDEIIFTSGGTESNVLAIAGACEAYRNTTGNVGEVIVTATEHLSVLAAARQTGAVVKYCPVDSCGRPDLVALKELLSPQTILVSIAYANNETGTIADIREIAKILRAYRKTTGTSYPYFHTDACQATRFLPMKVSTLGVDLMTINSGKVYGPKGVGALFVRRGVKISSVNVGGGQEFGLRSGTQNVPGIVGFTKALWIVENERTAETQQLQTLRDILVRRVLQLYPDTVVYGAPSDEHLPHHAMLGWPGVNAEAVVIGLDSLGIAVSTGSACSSKAKPESHVLQALGAGAGASSIRITLGRVTTARDIDRLVRALQHVLDREHTTDHLRTS